MFARGVVEEVRGRAPRRCLGYGGEGARPARDRELPLEEAREQIVMRTRRYAAYQRKWMRRIPGIVMVDADRHPEQVADAILDVARAR